MNKITTLSDLFVLILDNPTLAKNLKDKPYAVAEMFGVSLTQEEAEKIRANLNIETMQADSMAAKVAQGIGLEDLRS